MLKKENRYAFKDRLLEIHKRDRRDSSLLASDDEYEIKNGCGIRLVQEDKDGVVYTAARDFCDYMHKSMNVGVYTTFQNAPITLEYDKTLTGNSEYRIEVSKDAINVRGGDDRAIAQALFYLEDVMNLRKAPFIKHGVIHKKALLERRFTQSPFGFMEYTDEAFLHMAHFGMNAIMLWIYDYETTWNGHIDTNLICKRAKKYGIDVYAELYEKHRMAVNEEGAQEYYDSIYQKLFTDCPDLKGIFLTGEAHQFKTTDPNASNVAEHKGIPDPRPSSGWWPCSDYPQFVKMVTTAAKKAKPDVEVVFSSYNFGYAPKEQKAKMLEQLPTDVALDPPIDVFAVVKRGDVTENISDYTLAQNKPSQNFLAEAEIAKRRGIKLYAIANCSGKTWDFGVIPYEPMAYSWIERFNTVLDAIEKYNLCGIEENIHYGFYPSFITELEKYAFFTHDMPLEDKLTELLQMHFGKENASTVDRALRLWSEAVSHYPPCAEDQYGAFRIGPAYPLWSGRKGKKMPLSKQAAFGNDIFDDRYKPRYTRSTYSTHSLRFYSAIERTEKMRDLLLEGVKVLKSAKEPDEELLRLINLGEFMYRTTVTALNVREQFLLLRKFEIEPSKDECIKIVDRLEQILLEEKENVLKTIPLVQVDSTLGYEPSMEYSGDEQALLWKLDQLDYDLNVTIKKYKSQLEL